MKTKSLPLTEEEAKYLHVVLIKYRHAQTLFKGGKQDKEYTNIMNKVYDITRVFEGEEPLNVPVQ